MHGRKPTCYAANICWCNGRDRIVVSTSRCGRDNPGSNHGHGRAVFSVTAWSASFCLLQCKLESILQQCRHLSEQSRAETFSNFNMSFLNKPASGSIGKQFSAISTLNWAIECRSVSVYILHCCIAGPMCLDPRFFRFVSAFTFKKYVQSCSTESFWNIHDTLLSANAHSELYALFNLGSKKCAERPFLRRIYPFIINFMQVRLNLRI